MENGQIVAISVAEPVIPPATNKCSPGQLRNRLWNHGQAEKNDRDLMAILL